MEPKEFKNEEISRAKAEELFKTYGLLYTLKIGTYFYLVCPKGLIFCDDCAFRPYKIKPTTLS